MIDTIDLEIRFEELVNRGLNTKAISLHPQIDRLLKETIDEKVKGMFPRVKQQPWHYVKIKYSDVSEKYFITIAPGSPVPKG